MAKKVKDILKLLFPEYVALLPSRNRKEILHNGRLRYTRREKFGNRQPRHLRNQYRG